MIHRKKNRQLKDLRPELRRRGMTVRGFARFHSQSEATTRAALAGIRFGPVSLEIRRLAEREVYEKP